MDSEFMTESMLNLYDSLGADTHSDIMIYNHEENDTKKIDSKLNPALECPNLENDEEIHEIQKDYIKSEKKQEKEEVESRYVIEKIAQANEEEEDLEEDV
jgi:hypothetical protein